METRYNENYDTALRRLLVTDCTASALQETTVGTTQILSTIPEKPDLFTLRRGEVLLFHGTTRGNVSEIIQHGFKTEKNRRSAYGRGTYLTDSSQKADQYTDILGRRTKGLTMLLMRVALGWMVKEQFSHLDCDTVIAGKGNLFQEFVAKKDENLFPQFLIEYDRVHENDTLV